MSENASRALLAHAHSLLQGGGGVEAVASSLEALARISGCRSSGLACCNGWSPAFCHPAHDDSIPWPWERSPGLLELFHAGCPTVTLPHSGAGCTLAALAHTADGTPWLGWVESATRPEWPESEASAFALVVLAMGRMVGGNPAWAEQAARAARQARLESAAALTRHLSHDFGNILTGIIGFTELAQAQQMPSGSPLHSYLNEIHRAAQAGAHFTHQLRLFSRRQAGTPRPCPLPLALAGLGAKLQALRDAGHQVNLDIPNDLPPAALGPDGLQQVLGTLIDNAREAMTFPGAVSISARVADLDEAACQALYGTARPGPHVEITVADTGTGLSSEAMQRLFDEPFFSTKARRKGFGLAVSYGILAAHQCGLQLHPGCERGVVALVAIPVGADLHAGLDSVPAAPSTDQERILVIDDERDVLALVEASLKQSGYRVQPFREGGLALDAYFASQSSDPFALVLTDVVMPGLGGVELVRRLLHRDPTARVLFMSGMVSGDFLRHDFAGRGFGLVNKPFRQEELLGAVRTALNRTNKRTAERDVPLGGNGLHTASRK